MCVYLWSMHGWLSWSCISLCISSTRVHCLRLLECPSCVALLWASGSGSACCSPCCFANGEWQRGQWNDERLVCDNLCLTRVNETVKTCKMARCSEDWSWIETKTCSSGRWHGTFAMLYSSKLREGLVCAWMCWVKTARSKPWNQTWPSCRDFVDGWACWCSFPFANSGYQGAKGC